VNTREAVLAMIELSRSTFPDVAEQATYWVAFRQGNDWFALLDWSKTGIDAERQRTVEAMKVKRSKVLDARLPFNEKKWNAQDMARNAIGGQLLIGMVAESKLPQELYPTVEELIFKPHQSFEFRLQTILKNQVPVAHIP
jgi:hypothetical protein